MLIDNCRRSFEVRFETRPKNNYQEFSNKNIKILFDKIGMDWRHELK